MREIERHTERERNRERLKVPEGPHLIPPVSYRGATEPGKGYIYVCT